MATFIKIDDFVEGAMNEEHELDADVIEIALSNTDPTNDGGTDVTASGNGILANVTQISYTNYSDDLSGADRVLTNVVSVEASGTWKFDADNFIITASGGTIADWRYLYVFNQDASTPADPLIGVWDHGSAITLLIGETANININASGLITVA